VSVSLKLGIPGGRRSSMGVGAAESFEGVVDDVGLVATSFLSTSSSLVLTVNPPIPVLERTLISAAVSAHFPSTEISFSDSEQPQSHP